MEKDIFIVIFPLIFLNCSNNKYYSHLLSDQADIISLPTVQKRNQSFGCLKSVKEYKGISLMAQVVKNLPAMEETRVRSLHQEDPLEERMAIHSSVLAWRPPWTEEPGGLQPMGSQRVRHD